MEKISLICPRCRNRFKEQKKIAPDLSDPVDIDAIMYTCPTCHYRFLQNPRSKLQSIECIVDGIKFQSRLEARRYTQLKEMEKDGIIHNLVLQPKFLLQEKFEDPYTHKSYQSIISWNCRNHRRRNDGRKRLSNGAYVSFWMR